jgi:hypothetical protein
MNRQPIMCCESFIETLMQIKQKYLSGTYMNNNFNFLLVILLRWEMAL